MKKQFFHWLRLGGIGFLVLLGVTACVSNAPMRAPLPNKKTSSSHHVIGSLWGGLVGFNSGSYSRFGNQNQESIPIAHKSQSLPHNGLFIRRNNAFGTKMITGIEELIAEGVKIGHQEIRFDDFIAMNTKGIPLPKRNNALAVSHGIAVISDNQKRDDSKATHYLEIALKTVESAPLGHPETKALPVNYIFVVDTSSSMDGKKLDSVKTAIAELFTRLKADDVLGIIEFNNRPKTVLEATPVTKIDRYKFRRIINNLVAGGGTDINLGLSFGIDEIARYGDRYKVNQVFLFSDGNPTSGETNWIKIRQNIAKRTRRRNFRLSTFAFGTDASKTELDRLAGITGGQNTFVTAPKDVRISLQRALDRRKHLAAINVQMQIEIDPDIVILHLYGHDLITDPVRREAVLRELGKTKDEIQKDYSIEQPPDLITDEKGIRIFVPNLAVGETYWVVFEIAVPEQHSQSALGKATVQYLDTFARQNEKYRFYLSPKGRITQEWVTQHALGLRTSEVIFYALDDLYENDLDTAEKRIERHLSVLDVAKNDFVSDDSAEQLRKDVVTLNKFRSLAQNFGKPVKGDDGGYYNSPQSTVRSFVVNRLNAFGRMRNGFVQTKSRLW